MESTPPAKRHDNLWLSDGNVVLGTNAFIFKVHKSVLSMQSSVFRDMFALPTAGDTIDDSGDAGIAGIAPELYEGLHFVLLPDDGRDVEHVLRAIYERSYYDPHSNNISLDKFISLLRLSFKYEFGDMQRDLLGQLSRIYPTSLKEYWNAEDQCHNMLGTRRRNRWVSHLPLLKICVDVGIDDYFPSLYYASILNATSSILEFFSESPSNLPTLDRLICGNESMQRSIQGMLSKFISETDHCIYRHKARTDPDTNYTIEDLFEFFDIRPLHGITKGTLLNRACDDCSEQIGQSIESNRDEIWDDLPKIFGFNKTWDEIRDAQSFRWI